MNNTAGLLITMDKLAQYKSFFINIIFARKLLNGARRTAFEANSFINVNIYI